MSLADYVVIASWIIQNWRLFLISISPGSSKDLCDLEEIRLLAKAPLPRNRNCF